MLDNETEKYQRIRMRLNQVFLFSLYLYFDLLTWRAGRSFRFAVGLCHRFVAVGILLLPSPKVRAHLLDVSFRLPVQLLLG